MVYQTGPDSMGFYFFQNNWRYINFDNPGVPSTAIVLSDTNPNQNLQNSNFTYGGQVNFPGATITSIFPVASNIWQSLDTTVANYPANGTAEALSTWADSVFIIAGGYNGSNAGIPFYKYNPTTNKWVQLNTNYQANGASAVRIGNKWVFFGGIAQLPSGNAMPATIFDVGTYAITSSAALNDSARRFHTATAIGNNIYFWGGRGIVSSNYMYGTGYKYDLVANNWTPMATTGAPAARQFAGSVAAGTDVVIWGGYSPSLGFLNTGAIYRTATNTWVTMSATNAPTTATIDPAIAFYGSFVYIISGNETKRFDPVANTWTTMAPPPYAFNGQKFSYDGNGKIYVWGGARYFTAGAPVNTGYIYDIASNTYTTIPTTGAPSARAGSTVCIGGGNFLLVWGGSASTGFTPTTAESIRTGGVYYLNATNVSMTLPLAPLYLYKKN
jgi:N-acetylneuraminic acid mutarotase